MVIFTLLDSQENLMPVSKLENALYNLKQGNLYKGKQILEDLVLDDPRNPDILYNLGMCYSELKDLPAAINTLKQCIQYDPHNSNALAALGVAYARNKDFINAEAVAIKVN